MNPDENQGSDQPEDLNNNQEQGPGQATQPEETPSTEVSPDLEMVEPEASSNTAEQPTDQSSAEPEPSTTQEPSTPEIDHSAIFVDNPATQPNMPENIQNTSDHHVGSGKKSKKGLIALIIVALLAAAGAAYYFLVFSKTVSEAPATQQEESSTEEQVNSLVYQTNNMVKFYDVANSSAFDGTSIPDGAQVLSVSEDGKEVIYATFSSEESGSDNGSDKITVTKNSNGNDAVIYESTKMTDPFVSYIAISSDRSLIAFYGAETSLYGTAVNAEPKIYLAKLDGSNSETELVDATSDDYGPLQPRLFSSDNNSLYLGEASCYQCDGPQKPNVWKLNINEKSIANVYESTDDKGGNSIASYDGKYIAIQVGSDGGLGDPDYKSISTNTFEVYTLDTENDEVKKIYTEIKPDTEGSESFQTVAGWSQDSSNFIVVVPKITESSDTEIGYTKIISRFDAVDAVSGKVSQIPVQLDSINDSFRFEATTYENTLFFTTDDKLTTEGDLTTKYSLYALPLGQGVSEVKTIEQGLPKINILGSGQITKSN